MRTETQEERSREHVARKALQRCGAAPLTPALRELSWLSQGCGIWRTSPGEVVNFTNQMNL